MQLIELRANVSAKLILNDFRNICILVMKLSGSGYFLVLMLDNCSVELDQNVYYTYI